MAPDVRVDGPRIAPHMPELDGLRLLAFLAVFCFHATHVTARGTRWEAFSDSLSFGLPLFFVLSSYLITKNLLIERATTGRISLRRFYVRRVLRIWPLYLSFLLLTFLGGFVFRSLHMETTRFFAFLLMGGNFYVGSYGFGISPTYPLWSISRSGRRSGVVAHRLRGSRLRMWRWPWHAPQSWWDSVRFLLLAFRSR